MEIVLNESNREALVAGLESATGSSSSASSSTAAKTAEYAANEVYCICRRSVNAPEDADDMMIECDACKDWLHGRCVEINQRLAADIETYVCPRCVCPERQIVYKKRMNYHRHDFADANAQKKPIQAGTIAFVEQLLKRKFPDALGSNVVCKLNSGAELTKEYLEKNGFERPILVEDKEGLDFIMPSANEINLAHIENIVGGDYVFDVIDVERQDVFPMSIKELSTYFQATPRTKIYNLISFEISKTELTKNITAPRIVYEISWASNGLWPPEEPGEAKDDKKTSAPSADIVKPEVQKYCLISAGNSYTDFHIDFGGSSVWYHTVKGNKTFYLIEPTEENLQVYEKWSLSKNHSETFLGDKVKVCYKFEIKQGNTIFLPSGWIHAVYTPNDSLVFGGNFLQSYNIPLQLKIYDLEIRLKTPDKYRFPAFETFQWYAAKYYTLKLKEANGQRKCVKLGLFHGLKYLKDTLKRWLNSKDYYEAHDYQIPRRINCDKLVNVMNRELTKAEILLKSSGSYKSESSLKLKLKLSVDKPESSCKEASMDELNSKLLVNGGEKTTKSKSQKEVLVYSQKELLEIDQIGSDDNDEEEEEDVDEESAKDEPAPDEKPRLVMKLPKVFKEASSTTPGVEATPSEPATVKPSLKLKLRLGNSESVVLDVPKTSTEAAKEQDSDGIEKNDFEDDEDYELIKDLKNSYQDNDFIYPSLNLGTTARTAKKLQSNDSAGREAATEEKSVRKRKLKPHAVQYLMPKQEKEEPELESSESDTKPKKKTSAKKAALEKLIEKNLGKELAGAPKDPPSDAAAKLERSGDEDYTNDGDYDDDDDDYGSDHDFKIKCEKNLKLSKKLKKTSAAKQQKKMENPDESGSIGCITPSAIGASSKARSASNAAAQGKKTKKGYATTKQRLGKLLKLNRIVNI